jgi:hypothetical protein
MWMLLSIFVELHIQWRSCLEKADKGIKSYGCCWPKLVGSETFLLFSSKVNLHICATHYTMGGGRRNINIFYHDHKFWLRRTNKGAPSNEIHFHFTFIANMPMFDTTKGAMEALIRGHLHPSTAFPGEKASGTHFVLPESKCVTSPS